MVWFVIALIVLAIAVVAFIVAGNASAQIRKEEARFANLDERDRKYDRSDTESPEAVRRGAKITGGIAIFVGLVLLAFSAVFFQSVGEAKVIVNADGTIAGQKIDPGVGFKAPWQNTSDWDIFSQEVLYAGGNDGSPSYSGGTVSGKEVTVAVGGINGGSTQAQLDISVTYSIDADAVTGLYSKYKSQERFTKQVIEKTILSTIRQVPSDYNATEFRGTSRQEAADQMLSMLNERLNKNGVTVDFVNLQDIRYPAEVEDALKAIEVANQDIQKAEAEQRKKTVEAETKRIEAQGVADANAILNQSLTPEILQQKQIDAYNEGTVFVVPEGSTPFVQVQK